MTSRGGARKEICEVCDGSGRQQDNCLYNCRYCRGTGFDTSLPLKKGSDGIDWSKIKTKHSKRITNKRRIFLSRRIGRKNRCPRHYCNE